MPDIFTDVIRENGEAKTIRVVEGHLMVCKGCCCGNIERGLPAVPLEAFKREWKRRNIRNRVHLTITGCLGPCAVLNVALLIYQGSSVWLHSINSESDVHLIYEYIEQLLAIGRFEPPEGLLGDKVFQRYTTDAHCVAAP
jgi:cobaltochelatase CobN